jgi:hypothetical protein
MLTPMSRTAAAPILLTLARMLAAALLVLVVIAYFLVALGIEEYRTIWPRGDTSQTR